MARTKSQQTNNSQQTPNQDYTTADELLELVVNGTGVQEVPDLIDEYGPSHCFKSPEHIGYIAVSINEHKEVYPIMSDEFEEWLTHLYLDTHTSTVSDTVLKTVKRTLNAMARNRRSEVAPVYIRIAPYKDENGTKIYLDLADKDGNVIEISKDGYRVIDNPPVHFIRVNGMQPLPLPAESGGLHELRKFVNAPDDYTWIMYCAWLIGAFLPSGAYPILTIRGEGGALKSSSQRNLQRVIDPVYGVDQGPPEDLEAFMVSASNCFVMALDNLNVIPAWMSSALCRLSTGATHKKRNHYTMRSETVYRIKRPAIINSIEAIANRDDILERCLMVHLTKPAQYREETELDAEFLEALPRVLHGLCNAVATALRNVPEVPSVNLPRLADFARFVTAAETCFTHKGGFMKAYQTSRSEAIQIGLTASMLTIAILRFMEHKPVYEGGTEQLYKELEAELTESERKDKTWPKSSSWLGRRLPSHVGSLRECGITVDTGTRDDIRSIVRLENTQATKQSFKDSMDETKRRAR